MPPEIKKFSDIKLKDFHNQPLCNDKDSPWSKSYHATPNHKDFDLFKKYAKHIALPGRRKLQFAGGPRFLRCEKS